MDSVEQPAKSPVESNGRKRLKFTLKASVSLAFVWFLVRSVDVGASLAILGGSRKLLWFLALVLLVLSQLLSTFRWQILLKPLDFTLPWSRVFSIYFVGMFFSLFLPSLVGGDSVKTFYIAGNWKRVPAALYSLLADRTVGLSALLAYAAAGTVITWQSLPGWLARSMLLLPAAVYLVLPLLPRLSAPVRFLVPKLRSVPEERLFVYWRQPAPAVTAWGVSLIIHLCVVLSHLAMASSLGLPVSPAAWLIIYPSAALAAFVPVSLNGIGLREAAYVYMLGLFGVGREAALSLGLMWFSMVMINGLMGALPYLFAGSLKEGAGRVG